MFGEIKVVFIQTVGADIEAVDAGEHRAQNHHFRFFGMGGSH